MMDKTVIKQQARFELARRDFFYYCHLMASDFYKPSRKYLVELCNDLQGFLSDSEHNVLVINEPPRHGKSRTAGMFVQWLLGNDNNKKIMTGSYNETLSTVFSKNVRNAIQETKADKDVVVFNDIFPKTHIKYGDAAMNLWSLEGGIIITWLQAPLVQQPVLVLILSLLMTLSKTPKRLTMPLF